MTSLHHIAQALDSTAVRKMVASPHRIAKLLIIRRLEKHPLS
ncbi:MAG: hypothetical protein OFPII_21870 [Osedax symbiont Rs1]|nr:MAG: hypothetical protein OFPII_21870 [Osedax symbiont Rs1]